MQTSEQLLDRRRRRTAAESYQAKIAAPFAVLGVRTAHDRLTGIEYLPSDVPLLDPCTTIAERVCRQLLRYLEDPEFRFTLPYRLEGSDFRCRVWREIGRVPVGETRTYLDLARILETAPRAVGGACGANPIPIVVPCHRIVSRVGIGGFMNARSGRPLIIKRWLLAHEAADAIGVVAGAARSKRDRG